MTDAADLTDDPRVIAALRGERAVDDLNAVEQALFYDLVGLADPTETTRAFFVARRQRGGGVGYDDQNRLVRGLPGGSVEVLRDANGTPVGPSR